MNKESIVSISPPIDPRQLKLFQMQLRQPVNHQPYFRLMPVMENEFLNFRPTDLKLCGLIPLNKRKKKVENVKTNRGGITIRRRKNKSMNPSTAFYHWVSLYHRRSTVPWEKAIDRRPEFPSLLPLPLNKTLRPRPRVGIPFCQTECWKIWVVLL